MSPIYLYIVIFLAGLLFSGFFSMLEAAVISQDRHRLQSRADAGDSNAQIMRELLFERTDTTLAAILLCNNLANVSCATAAAAAVARVFGESETALLAATFVVTFALLVCSEVTPKAVGVRHASRIAPFFARPLRALTALLSPVLRVVNFFSYCLLWLFGLRGGGVLRAGLGIAELRAIVRDGRRNKQNAEEFFLLEKSLQFHNTPVEKIMTPRRRISGVDINASPDSMRAVIANANHAKLPLYYDSIDRLAGAVDTVRAMRLAAAGGLAKSALLAIAERPHYAPAAAGAQAQMRRMRDARARLAFVVDGGGRVVGLLTFANFAAAILGEEKPPEGLQKAKDGGWDLHGHTQLAQLEGLNPPLLPPPNTEATTINGVIIDHLGDVPESKLCPLIADWQMEITDLGETAVRRVHLYPQRRGVAPQKP